MFTLDATTRAEYDAQPLAADKAQAVVDALGATVTVKVYDDLDAVRASGTMDTPWATAVNGRIVIGEVTSFTVTNGVAADPWEIPAGWTLRFEGNGRSGSGSFGHVGSGADFTWSLATFRTGQGGFLGTVEAIAQGFTQVQQDYALAWAVHSPVSSDAVFGWNIAPPGSSPLTFSGIPNPIQITQGGSYDLSQHVSGGTPPYSYDHAGYSLTPGVTLNFANGLLSASSSATVGTSTDIVFGVTDSALTSVTKDYGFGWAIEAPTGAPATLPVFGITSAAGGASLPFSFGHVFPKGVVPSSRFVSSDLADWQCSPLTRWPDGSLRHAIIAGRATCSAGVRRGVALSVSATDRTGDLLTEADLAAALPANTRITAGTETISLDALIGTAARHRTVCAGPVMANWIYRKALASSPTLVAWFDVRLYVGGAIEILPWVENCPMFAACTNDVRTWIFVIGGVTRFSASLDIKHHTRVPLIDNRASAFKHFSYWVGADPQIEPQHDTAYMMASGMVPNYGWATDERANSGVGGGSDYQSFTQTFHPNWIGDTKAGMAAAGFGKHIGVLPTWGAVFLTSGGDPRPYRSVIANSLAYGAWHIHYRDETADGAYPGSSNEPLKYSKWPNAYTGGSGGTQLGAGTGGVNTDGNSINADPDQSHQPSTGYLAWLLTGRWYFLEETMFWVTWTFTAMDYVKRQGASGICLSGPPRYRGWAWRSIAQLLAALPENHVCFSDIQFQWEENMRYYHGRVITGTEDGGGFVNNLGVMAMYGGSEGSGATTAYHNTQSDVWWGAPWMKAVMTFALGHAWDLGLPQSATSETRHQALRDFAYKMPVGYAGDGSAGTYNYRRFGPFSCPFGIDGIGLPLDQFYANYGEVYDWLEANYNAETPLNPLPAGTALYQGDSVVIEGNWSRSSGLCFQYVALAWAREHGATGATEAWNRITASDSWALTDAAFTKNPIWGIYPRNVA